jgi:hypothetical protein
MRNPQTFLNRGLTRIRICLSLPYFHPVIFPSSSLSSLSSTYLTMGQCPSTPTCPTHNQCTYAADGTSFAFACGLDYFEGNLAFIEVSPSHYTHPLSPSPSPNESSKTDVCQGITATQCMNTCLATSDCVAVTLTNDACVLKSSNSVPKLR